jgi:glucan 1,3-beta-glucosidase
LLTPLPGCSYVEAYTMIREITGVGEGKGPFISIHDGFQGLKNWAGFMKGADRVALDMHPYFAFSGSPATSPIDTGTGADAGGTWPAAACDNWAASMNTRSYYSSSFFLPSTS